MSLWGLPPAELAVTLFQLIETEAVGAAAYYADVTQAVITLAVTAPPGPPADGAAFLDRLEPGWLEAAYAGDASRLGAVAAARRSLADVSLRYRTLLSRLGPGLDGPGTLTDADAWYFILEGTREQSVAEAQAMALTELVAHAATSPGAQPRAILLACDDYSAVSGRVPLWQFYERGRSLGVGVQVSAQSWQGLGRDDDERRRIAATADGGIWLMRTPYPQPISELAGTRRVIETATKVVGGVWGDEGQFTHPARLDRRPRYRPPPRSRAGRVHPRRRVHLGPDRPAPPLPAAPAPTAGRTGAHPPSRSSSPPPCPSAPPDDLQDVFGPEARP